MLVEISSTSPGKNAVLVNYLVNHLYAGYTFMNLSDGFNLPVEFPEHITGAVIDTVQASLEERLEIIKWFAQVKRPFILIHSNQL